jgi:hypothetical protein
VELLKRLGEQASVAILVDNKSFIDQKQIPISIPIREPLTLAAAFSALVDQYDVCFLFRDYGILVTNNKRARNISAPAIPGNLPLNADAK